MLFKVKSSFKDADITDRIFFAENQGAEAIAEFSKLTTRQMFFVCLVADRDPDSPLRTLPEEKRRLHAAEIVGYPLESDGKRLDRNGRDAVQGKVESIEAAITRYRELQPDELKDQLDAVNMQIQEAIDLMRLDKKELCTVIKKTKNKGNDMTTEESRFDGKMYTQMVKDAMTLGTGLVNLKETRQKLIDQLPKPAVLTDITTYTSNDIPHEESSEDQSTIDTFMERKREITNG